MHSSALVLMLLSLFAVSATSALKNSELKRLFREQFDALVDTVENGENKDFVLLFGGKPTRKAVREAKKLVRSLSGNEYVVGKVSRSHRKIVGKVDVFNGESDPYKCLVVLTKSAASPTGYKFSEIVPLDGKKRTFWGAVIGFAAVAVNLVTLIMFPDQ